MSNLNLEVKKKSNYKVKTDELNILRNAMNKSGIPEDLYSIGSFMEESICIEKKTTKWVVYSGERGNKYNFKTYTSFLLACRDFLSRVSESKEQEDRLMRIFRIEYIKNKRKNIGMINSGNFNQSPDQIRKSMYINAEHQSNNNKESV